MNLTVDEKSPLKSKTLWLNLVVAICALFVPKAQEFILSNPDLVLSIFAVINIILRAITKDKLTLS